MSEDERSNPGLGAGRGRLGESLIAALEGAQDPVLLAGLDGSVQYANRAFWKWYGSSDQALEEGLSLRTAFGVALAPDVLEAMGSELRSGRAWATRQKYRLAGGEARTVRIRVTPVRSESDEVAFLLAHVDDLSEELDLAEQQAERKRANLLLDLLGTSLGELEPPVEALRWIAGLEDTDLQRVPQDLRRPLGRVRRASQKLLGLFRNVFEGAAGSVGEREEEPEMLVQLLLAGASPERGAEMIDALRGEGVRCLLRVTRSEDALLRGVKTNEIDAVLLGEEITPEAAHELVRKLNRARPRMPVFDVKKVDVGALARGLRRSVAAFRQEQGAQEAWRRMEDLALRDGLTGVFNRRAVERYGQREFAQSARYDFPIALALFDLDHFKEVNDRGGHGAGDRVLLSVASTLQAGARATDVVARLGGDEFVVVMTHTDGAGGLAVGERLRKAIQEPLRAQCAELGVRVGVSVGLAVAPAEGIDRFEDLLERADAALYRAKRAGRGRLDRDLGARSAR